MNTRLNYLYRDGCNYKVYNTCVIEGEMTNALFERICATLFDGACFVPELVGLPAKDMVDEGYEYDPEIDTVLYEFSDPAFELTDEEADVCCTAAELVERFERCKGKWL